MAPPLIPPPPPISAYYQHNHPPVTWHDRNANCRISVQYAKGKQFTIGHGLGRQIPGPIQLQKPSSASPLKFPSVRSLNPRRLHRLAGRIQRQRSHNSVIGSSMWGFILQPMTTVQSTGANGAKGRRKTALPARVTPKQKLKSIPTVLELGGSFHRSLPWLVWIGSQHSFITFFSLQVFARIYVEGHHSDWMSRKTYLLVTDVVCKVMPLVRPPYLQLEDVQWLHRRAEAGQDGSASFFLGDGRPVARSIPTLSRASLPRWRPAIDCTRTYQEANLDTTVHFSDGTASHDGLWLSPVINQSFFWNNYAMKFSFFVFIDNQLSSGYYHVRSMPDFFKRLPAIKRMSRMHPILPPSIGNRDYR